MSSGSGQEKRGPPALPLAPGGGLVFVSLIICTVSSGLPLRLKISLEPRRSPNNCFDESVTCVQLIYYCVYCVIFYYKRKLVLYPIKGRG